MCTLDLPFESEVPSSFSTDIKKRKRFISRDSQKQRRKIRSHLEIVNEAN